MGLIKFHSCSISKITILVYAELVRLITCLLLTALFVSCAGERKSPDIKDIVNQWIDIEQLLTAFTESAAFTESHTPQNSDFVEKATLLEMSDVFYQSLLQFQRSDLYRIYRAIPFSRQTERSFNLYPITDIQEVSIVSDLALLFRNSIVSGDMEKAKAVSA